MRPLTLEERAIGSLQLTECLAEDPFGCVYRGLEWIAPRTSREVLVRQYHPVWLELGLSARRHEILRNLVHLGHLKPFKGCHAGRDGAPHLVWPYAAGRSLAQVLKAAESQGVPFGIDQALFLVWALSHHIRHLHQVKLSPGLLSPHRVWIGFDGWVQLLDLPVIGILQEVLPSVPGAPEAMASYLLKPPSAGLEDEAFQLGALLYEMLTHRPLSHTMGQACPAGEARLGYPGLDQGPLPGEVVSLIERLLGNSEPFQTLEELEHTIEDSVFGGDFEPSTFGLAFAVQTLFRREIEASAMVANGTLVEADVNLTPKTSAPGAGKAGSGAFSPRRMGLLTSAFLIGGVAVWLSTHAFTHQGIIASTPVIKEAAVSAQTEHATPVLRVAKDPLVPGISSSAAPSVPDQPKQEQTHPIQAHQASGEPYAPKGRSVKLRVFVDEAGRVRQVHLLSGVEEGSEGERLATAMAMAKTFLPAEAEGKAIRSWEEITVVVP